MVSRRLSDQDDLNSKSQLAEALQNSNWTLSECLLSIVVGSNTNMQGRFIYWGEEISAGCEYHSVRGMPHRNLLKHNSGPATCRCQVLRLLEPCSPNIFSPDPRKRTQDHGSEQFTQWTPDCREFCLLRILVFSSIETSESSIYTHRMHAFLLGCLGSSSISSYRNLKMDMSSMNTSSAPAATSSMSMSMGSSSHCKISMLWNWYTIDACTLP
jgi:hypothetical protein